MIDPDDTTDIFSGAIIDAKTVDPYEEVRYIINHLTEPHSRSKKEAVSN